MFGVLVVKNEQGKLGYLTAFSGKLAGINSHKRFVPPIYDMLEQKGFFLNASEEINNINHELENLENDSKYKSCLQNIKHIKEVAQNKIELAKEKKRLDKAERKRKRKEFESQLTAKEFQDLIRELGKQSVKIKYDFKKLKEFWDHKIALLESEKSSFEKEISTLKQERKKLSLSLQKWLFDQYQFLNKNGDLKSLLEIFSDSDSKVPPAGAGECAAPKLLQYAFKYDMAPIAIAEFWWGESLSEVRTHGQFYPACTGKCMPILHHMLQDIKMDSNPLLETPDKSLKIEVIYDDPYLAIINKPPELLSVPGKNIKDSVFSRMRSQFPNAKGPLIVHRLDMSTSGLMIIPKSLDAYKYIQRQFIKRTINKLYVAILDGRITNLEGEVNLPLRVDLDDRPRQLVCYDHGKSARTKWEVIGHSSKTTRVHFYPLTGRTHQLRVHAAHPLGLNTSILGDDLYGKRAKRLMLHAKSISFVHPESRKLVSFSSKPEF